MLQNNFQALRNNLQFIAKLHRDLAEKLQEMSSLITQLSGIPANPDEPHWELVENDYGRLVDYAKCHWPKYRTESWPTYSTRLSKQVGWSVDYRTLRRCFERKNEA